VENPSKSSDPGKEIGDAGYKQAEIKNRPVARTVYYLYTKESTVVA